MSSATKKPVLISGAGLASLLFAQGLLRANIPFVIYERDASLSFRAQGYRLRLSTEGLDAIESVLSPEDWQRFWETTGKTGGGGFEPLNAVTGNEIKPDGSGPPKPADHLRPGGKMELGSRGGKVVGIARGDMRKLFMRGLEDKVQWSHQITGYELTSHGITALFADGSKSLEGDMLVGGDGIHSKIAKQVSAGKLKTYDTGARGIHGQAPTTAFKGLGEGVWRMVDETKGDGRKVFVITNVRPDDMNDASIHFGWTMGAQPGVIEAPNNDCAIIGKPAADIAKKLTADWHPRFKPLFEQMNEDEAAFWKITCSTPSGVPLWQNAPRVTVIGDAAHSMTPAGGLGANTAVRDSALLSGLIVEKGGFAYGITAAYEEQMRVYASDAVANSYGMATEQFGIIIHEDSSPTV
ncbi:FAD-binding domain protein [Teratosphaeria nubilosa]|uniref:FAD-binding domain protein n=1 Tax=Teratosphaeria nubilosa TaxID=161662 RepID=A0A6G1L2X2_9PEZI|nr:FAD-binding domain protein [Teratosphaeria nubilosa]